MKNKLARVFSALLVLFLLLAGCSADDAQAYDAAIESGLEELENDDYDKAIAYFEIALDEKADDERALVLIDQTESYVEALSLYEDEAFEDAMDKAEDVQSMEDGSDYLMEKAKQLLDEMEAALADSEENEEEAASDSDVSKTYKFEDFKGIYASFAGIPYESDVESIFLLSNTTVINGLMNSGYTIGEIRDQTFEGETFILDVHIPEQPGYGEYDHQYRITLAYDEKDYKHLTFEDEPGAALYPIKTDDLVDLGFNVTADSQGLINELKPYDEKVPQSLALSNTSKSNSNESNTSKLEDYSAKQIEYARVWLNAMNHPEVIEIHVYYEEAGTPINTYDENSAVYPEDVVMITGFSTSDGMIVYSGNGDGTINIYEVPSHWQSSPEEWPAIYEEILATESIYLDPLNDDQVIEMIQKMTIHN